jgi:hypothetical protein
MRQLLYGHKPHMYRILFTVKGDVVYVLRIRHGRRSFLGEPLIEKVQTFRGAVNPSHRDLDLVVEDRSTFYRASNCLTLGTAYYNARQSARPDRDWLKP